MEQNPRKKRRYTLRKGPIVTLSFFIFIWLIGVNSGEPARVLEQAVQICLSCIGLG